MFSGTQLGKSLDISWRQLSTLSYRGQVMANNITNFDTPNFRRSTVNFETKLNEALQSEKHVPVLDAAKTHKDHMSFFDPIDYRTVAPRRTLDWQTQSDNNGNNVDLESETTNMKKLANQYQLIMKSVSGSYEKINIVLG